MIICNYLSGGYFMYKLNSKMEWVKILDDKDMIAKVNQKLDEISNYTRWRN